MVLRVLGLPQMLFRAAFDPKMQFGCMAPNVLHYSG